MRIQSFITPETERDGGGRRVRGGDMEKKKGEEREGESARKSKGKGRTKRRRRGQRANGDPCEEREKIHLVDGEKEWRKWQMGKG